MRFNAFPPALIFQGKHPTHSQNRSFVVILSKAATKSTLAHELWHVRQFWAKLAIGAVLGVLFWYFAPSMPQTWLTAAITVLVAFPNLITEIIPAWDYSSETAAYAESVRNGRPLERCANALANNPKLYGNISFADAIADISDKVGRNRLGWFTLH